MTQPEITEGPVTTSRLTLHTLRSRPVHPKGQVLLLGGSNFDLRLKRQFLETSLARNYEIVTFEPRGIGRSTQPPGTWEMSDYASDALSLIDTIGWKRPHVIGESFGGMTALHLAIAAPARIARLALVSATAGGAGGGSAEIAHLLDLPPEEAAAEALMMQDTANIDLRKSDPATFRNRLAGRMSFDRAFHAPSVASGGYRRLLEARANHDAWDALGSIHRPTVVIAGKRDRQAPLDAQRAMAGRLPHAVLWEYDSGHGVAFATPAPMEALTRHWDEIDRDSLSA